MLRTTILGLALALCGCADSTPPSGYPASDGAVPPSDTGVVMTGDAYVPPVQDSAVPPAPATCPPAPPSAALPAVTGTYLHTGGASPQSVPGMTGGSPIGTWGTTHVTVYLPPSAAGFVTAETSTISGNGWFAYDANGQYRYALNLNVSVATILGPQNQNVQLTSVGTYTLGGATINATAQCTTGAEGATVSSAPTIQFTANGGTTSQFLISVPSDAGVLNFVIDGTLL